MTKNSDAKLFACFSSVILVAAVGLTSRLFAADFASQTVKFDELNLNSTAGATVLLTRIHNAAKLVCAIDVPGLRARAIESRCIADSEARAVKQVDNGNLTAVYAAKTGQRLPVMAANNAK